MSPINTHLKLEGKLMMAALLLPLIIGIGLALLLPMLQADESAETPVHASDAVSHFDAQRLKP
ncbi:MAG TPA: hypothetical protein VLA61_24310 [Ideonella sp.]|uniref:hypothetical protein n=1 Tax=Ideonella sp. TaxID=1929293 RepID=UPI002CCD0788|nr:hypothetical protein [Ideonella sp.]HSI51403.1 hypothetical protein [Ideonella sp.]